MAIQPLCNEDGSWPKLKKQWRAECATYNEDFDNYAVGTFAVLDPLAANGHPKAEIYAYGQDGSYAAFCQVNHTKIPDYDGPVLRVRMMTLAPKFDFGEFGIKEYTTVLVGLFAGVLELSIRKLPSRYIKFHLRSPADSQFFAALGAHFGKHPAFELVEVRGMWLYVTKAKRFPSA